MKGKDEIKDLFSDKLGSFEAPVRPELWTNIASQVGTTSTLASTAGLSLFTKSIIGVGIVGAAVVTTVLLIKPNSEENKREKSIAKTAVVDDTIENKQPATENNLITINKETTPKLEKTITNEVQPNSPEPSKVIEMDQDQNFKTDISPLKEKTFDSSNNNKESNINTPSEIETVNNKSEETVSPIKEENIKESSFSKDVISESIITEEKQIAYTLSELPNIFTPNGDGNNDFLFIESEGLVDFTIVVLDAKQKVMFESNDPNFKWNGVDKSGNTVPEGSYGYYIIAIDKNGNKVNKFVALEVRL